MSKTVQSPSVGLGHRIRDAHLGSLFAALATGFIVLKVVAVSHFEITTALGIVAESGTASLLVGALIRTLPSILLAAFFGLLLMFDDDATSEPDRRVYRVAAWAVAAVAALTQPIAIGGGLLVLAWMGMGGRPVGFLARLGPQQRNYRDRATSLVTAMNGLEEAQLGLKPLLARANTLREELDAATSPEGGHSPDEAEELYERLSRALDQVEQQAKSVREHQDALEPELEAMLGHSRARIGELKAARHSTRLILRGVALFYAALMIVRLLADEPWLPAEHITVDGQDAIIGYVLKAESDELVILDDGPRQLVRIDGAKLQDRRYCVFRPEPETLFGPSITSHFYEAPSYPRCNRLGA